MSLEPGVSRVLADERARRLCDLRYALSLSIPGERHLPIAGDLVISFALADTDAPLALDFAPDDVGRLHSCSANGVRVDAAVEQEHVLVPAAALRRGPNTLRLGFSAGDTPLNRRDDHLYSIFVPARAREAFPCFDQPNLKARWTLTLEIPADWMAVSNAEEATRRLSAGVDAPGREVVTFAETELLPTYLFAFAAGHFNEEVAEREGRRIRLYHRCADAELLALNLDAIIDGHADALRWLDAYTAIPYPFGKFDVVLLPAFQFGGMEHPGAIFYNAATLLLPSSATEQQHLARANVIAHETAHMWFGDLVTMTWFDDVWMKEVFANFMAAKIVNPQFGELDHDLRFLHGHYPAAYDVDRTAGANAIRQPLANLNEAGALYGAIIYLKSPIVIRQLELVIGESALREALREYLSHYRFGNASWRELLDILAPRAALDLGAWSRDWIDTPGRPSVRTVLTLDGNAVSRLELVWQSPGRPQRLDVALGYGPRMEHVEVWLESDLLLSALAGHPAPDYVLPNGRGLGYGAFELDERSRAWLLRHLPDVPDALTRGSAWLTLWDECLAGNVAPTALLDLALRALPREASELNLQRILSVIERLYWSFHSPEERALCAARLEDVLRSTLDEVDGASRKAALFACLRSCAATPATVEWLDALWSGTSHIDGLALGEADQIALAQELAVRRDDDGVVGQQVARTVDRDRKDALAFIAPALSSDPHERDHFFATISDAGNRRCEPWVIDGLRWLHHPLRAESSVKYLSPGLRLLEEVKRTGDIFLPKRWLDAMLSGHRSAEAAVAVREFLERLPADYPAALRMMVLASADYLFRAVERRV